MTREEAIENLRRLQNLLFNDPYIDTSTIIATCNIAIEALEQQPCIQEKQANADKIDAVYIDGFKAGYSQARFDLEQEPCDEEYIKVPKKALKYRTAGMVAYNAEWLRNHFDIERTVICGSQEPCENAISRQAALDAMRELPHEYRNDEQRARTGGIAACQVIVEELPSVSTEKTGRWIDDEFGSRCSCCGVHTHLDKFDRPMKFRHCSMCGAKMVETQESEVQDADSN